MLKEIKIGNELKCLRCGNKVLVEEIKLKARTMCIDIKKNTCSYRNITETITCHHCGNEYGIQDYYIFGEEWGD